MAWRLLVYLACAASLAGCLNTFEEPEHLQPHYIRIVNLDVSPARVLSQEIALNVTTTLDNRGGADSDPVRLYAKAYSEDRGFLIAENATEVGIVRANTTRAVPLHLTVPREGSVRIDVALFEADLGKERASVSARNLGSVEPEILDTGLRVMDVDFLVGEVTNGTPPRVRIQTDLYITNEGTSTSEDLQVQVKAREVQTSLVADVQWVGTGAIEPQTTAIRTVNLTVPDDYNYVFEIVTWRDQTIVARSEGAVQLAPTFVKRNDTEIVTTDTNVNDFVKPTPVTMAPTYEYGAPHVGAPTPSVPGPALAVVVLALAAVALALRRRS